MTNKETIVVPVRTKKTKRAIMEDIARGKGIKFNKLMNELIDNCIKNSILDKHF